MGATLSIQNQISVQSKFYYFFRGSIQYPSGPAWTWPASGCGTSNVGNKRTNKWWKRRRDHQAQGVHVLGNWPEPVVPRLEHTAEPAGSSCRVSTSIKAQKFHRHTFVLFFLAGLSLFQGLCGVTDDVFLTLPCILGAEEITQIFERQRDHSPRVFGQHPERHSAEFANAGRVARERAPTQKLLLNFNAISIMFNNQKWCVVVAIIL